MFFQLILHQPDPEAEVGGLKRPQRNVFRPKLSQTEVDLSNSYQNELLNLVEVVLTADDNSMLEAVPTKAELLSVLNLSNLKAAAGSDGIPDVVYK